YDAMGRRVSIIEWDNSTTPEEESKKYFLWDGLSIAEERDGGTPATVAAQYFAQGEIRDGVKYYYGRDHLGSVRDVVDESTGNVVAAQVLRCTALGEDTLDHLNRVLGLDRAARLQKQTHARELVDARQPLDRAAIGQAVVEEIPRPHLVRSCRAATDDAVRRIAQSPLPDRLFRHFEALLSPQSVHAFVVRPKALLAQLDRDAPVAKARVLAHQLVHASHHAALVVIDPRRVPLRRPRLTSDFASPSLRYLKAALKHVDRL